MKLEAEDRKVRITQSQSEAKKVHDHIDTMQSKIDSIRQNMRERMKSLKDNINKLDSNDSVNLKFKVVKHDSPIK
jgi:peptidoglycan hydrolase CwlO-like protein